MSNENRTAIEATKRVSNTETIVQKLYTISGRLSSIEENLESKLATVLFPDQEVKKDLSATDKSFHFPPLFDEIYAIEVDIMRKIGMIEDILDRIGL